MAKKAPAPKPAKATKKPAASKRSAIEEGKPAPDLMLPADDGSTFKLSKERGSAIVLYFYPRDNTPGCTREACAFRDKNRQFTKLGVKVVGISPDTLASHEKFRDQYDLNFRLLSDPKHEVAEKYGVWVEKNMYGKKSMGILRSTFLIDAKGVVRKVWRRVSVDGHDEAVLKAIQSL